MAEEDEILRPNAVEMLQSYVSDTLDYFDTVTAFCNSNGKWTLQRETELERMRDIQERASRLNSGFLQVFKADKGKAFGEYFRNLWSSDRRREELEKELATVLKSTLEGVERLTDFLDAVEKLAVTSLQVFTGGEEVVKLSVGISLESVEAIISAARLVCPLLLRFKRDAEVFFTPSLHNVAVFVAELDKYILTTEKICKMMDASFGHKRHRQPLVVTVEDLQKTLVHVQALSGLRPNAMEMLQSYFSDTQDYFDKVTAFCNSNGKWTVQRETELEMMRDIQERASRGFLQVFQATDKGKAFGEYFTSGTRPEELEKELATVLKSTLEGVEKLSDFLDAVEKLTVTSLQVFTGGEEVVKLSVGISLESVEDIILAARQVCPLLLRFKTDAKVFFKPSLHNVVVFVAELDKFILTTEKICKMMDASFGHKRHCQPLVVTVEDLQKTLVHVQALSGLRPNVVEMLQSYFSDTQDYSDKVTAFCNSNGKWTVQRETELERMRDIQERASRGFLQVFQATDKVKAFGEYFTSGTRHEELKRELAAVLKSTLEGVEKLTDFLDAVEKLAVTSLQVFTSGEEVVKLSVGISLESVKDIISAARQVCPLLLCFKRDAEVFFTPSLHNVVVFVAELDKYIRPTEKICKMMDASFGHKRHRQPLVVTVEDLQKTLVHVQALSGLRPNVVEMLQSYFSDTQDYSDKVTAFCNSNGKWMVQRETELEMMRDIQERASRGFLQVFQATDKVKAFGEYFTSGTRHEELKRELATVLKSTLEGVEKLSDFLDAVEKLAVTSLQVFMFGEEVVKLSLGISLESVEDIISAVRLVCPLLLRFKRDAEVFFTPSLHNVVVFEAELDKYILTTEKICKMMDASFGRKRHRQPLVVTVEDLQKTLVRVQALSGLRPNAVEMLQSYFSDTQDYFDKVTAFCNSNGKWTLQRETELERMRDIQERASRGFLQVFQATDKGKAFGEYFTRCEELEKELATVLKSTLEGVEKLSDFLDAVEKLAVTSLQVFMFGEEVVKLSVGISLESVEDIILAARLVCPLLLRFKRDVEVFFTPSLHNVVAFEDELDKFILTTEKICKMMDASFTVGFWHKRHRPPLVEFAEDLTEEDLQKTLDHVQALSGLRRNQNFRLVFLFQEKSVSGFVDQYSECRSRMLQFLDDMEGCAVQLDQMSTGSKISTVAGSSVGAVGGILAIVGLALAPVTAGVSLGLTMGGVGLGVTSGVNSLVTTVTELAVNKVQQKRASEGLQNFMKDVKRIQACLDEVTNQREAVLEEDYSNVVKGGALVVRKVSTIGKGIDVLVDGLDDVGMAAVRGPAALSKSARAGFITLNALFLGLDIFMICKESISLAKGDKSDISQFIRARAAVLRSMLEAWQTTHEALICGLPESKRGLSLLEQPLNPLKEATENDV